MPNEADLQALLSNIRASIRELENAVFDMLDPRMPAGFDLQEVNFEGGLQVMAYCSGLSSVSDARALAAGFNVDLDYHRDVFEEVVLTVSVPVGPLTVRFEQEVPEGEWREIRAELFES